MIRFADLLRCIYRRNGQVVFAAPSAFASRMYGLHPLARKYFAYIDKLLLFPLFLLLSARSFDLVHIADHGNAFYSFCIPRGRCIVTCHDLLAVRGAMGDASAFCEASPIGIWLQRLIMAGLRHAAAVAFDSQSTFQDYQRLIANPPAQRQAVIPIPLNAPFNSDSTFFSLTQAEVAQIPQAPYLLMVGSSHPRKNRTLALQLLEHLGPSSPYMVVFAGAPLTVAHQTFRACHPLGDRLISIEEPSHALLNRLYCQAHALLFPSFAEGFGWPLVEAQTCSCPVIASTTTSIPEVAGEGALYADPTDVASFADHVRALEDPTERAKLIASGINNTRRYDADVVSDAYRRFAFELTISSVSIPRP